MVKPDAPFLVYLTVYLVFRLNGSLHRRLFLAEPYSLYKLYFDS